MLALGERVTPVSGVDVWLDPKRVECHLLEYYIFEALFKTLCYKMFPYQKAHACLDCVCLNLLQVGFKLGSAAWEVCVLTRAV